MNKIFMQSIKRVIGLFLIVFLFGCNNNTVQDDSEPVFLNIPEDVTIVEETDLDLLDLGLTASDDVDGDLTDSIAVDILDTSILDIGEFVVTFTVSDEAGNTATQTINLTVIPDDFEILIVNELEVTIYGAGWSSKLGFVFGTKLCCELQVLP